jgi:hypothetical protein
MINIGIGIPFGRRKSGAAIDAQAQAHFDRVIADGGVVPSGLSGVNAFFTTVKAIYGTADITTAISVGLDAQVLGYKLGAGAGTTLGQAAQKLYSCSGASGDVVQTTAASQPLLLVHSGANYAWLPKVAGNFFSSPSSTASNLRSNFEFIAYGLNLHTLTGDSNIYGRFNTNQYQSIFGINSSLQLYLSVSIDGINILSTYTSTVALPTTSNISVKVTRVQSTGEIKFFTNIGSGWNQLGSTIIGTTSLLFNSSSAIQIGTYINGNIGMLGGSILRVTAANAIDGSPVVDFNPNQYNAATSQTQWVSTSGETWTINVGTATTGYKGQIVTKTIVQGDGVDDSLVSGTLISKSLFSRFCALNVLNLTNGRYYIGTNTNSDAHLIFPNFPNLQLYNTGTGIGAVNFTGFTSNRLNLYSGNYNQALSKTRVNNANETTGTTGNTASTSLIIFSNSSVRNSNAIITTLIDTTSVSSDSQLTSMYNYIRSINGNSF